MILLDKRPQQQDFVNFTDYTLRRPEGKREFFAFINFEDNTTAMLANIFVDSRLEANIAVLNRFADCLPYITNISIQESF